MVSESWKALSNQERCHWEQIAACDKARYDIERACYDGPWKIAKGYRPKDPMAPKRPMSAFLAYSNSVRPAVREAHPNLRLTEATSIMAAMWNAAPAAEREPFLQEHAVHLLNYRTLMAAHKQRAAANKQQREFIATQRAVDLGLCSMAAVATGVLVGAKEEEAHRATGSDVVTSSSSNKNSWESVAVYLLPENAALGIVNK